MILSQTSAQVLASLTKTEKPLPNVAVTKPSQMMILPVHRTAPPRNRSSSKTWPAWFDELVAPQVVLADADGILPDDAEDERINGAQEVKAFDHRIVTGTPQEINALEAARTRFTKATGKGLTINLVSEARDGNTTLSQTKSVCRIR